MRRGWSNKPAEPGFFWATTPMFDAYIAGHKVAVNEHPLEDFLPVDVELTAGSVHDQAAGLSKKGQRFCVSSRCVKQLRDFCELVRPELVSPHGAHPKKRQKKD